MSRVTTTEVRVILPSDTLLTDPQIQAAIDAAACIVDRVECDLTDACMKQVELYLSAHTAAITENTLSLSSEKDPCSGGAVTYGFIFGEGVKGTPFGQMANMLSGGCLAEYDKQPVGMFSIGSIAWG